MYDFLISEHCIICFIRVIVSLINIKVICLFVKNKIIRQYSNIDYNRHRGKQSLYVLRGKHNIIDIYTLCLVKFGVLILMKTLLLLLLIIVVYLKKKN